MARLRLPAPVSTHGTQEPAVAAFHSPSQAAGLLLGYMEASRAVQSPAGCQEWLLHYSIRARRNVANLNYI